MLQLRHAELPKVNGNLQPLPLILQAAVLCLKPGVDVGKILAKMDHRTHRFTEEPEAHSAAPASERELITKTFASSGGRLRGVGCSASRRPGAGWYSPTT